MRAAKSSPLFRIALLSLAVLFAHTIRASAQPILRACQPCPGKVAAAQPDSQKKLFTTVKRNVRGRQQKLSSGWFQPAAVHGVGILPGYGTARVSVTRWSSSMSPQGRAFVLRI